MGQQHQTLKPLQFSSNIYHLHMSPHLSSDSYPLLFKRSKGSFSFSIHTRKGKTEERRRGETGRMQSRLLAVVVRCSSFFPLFPRCLSNYPLFTTSQCCGAGEPAVHSEFPQVSFYFSSTLLGCSGQGQTCLLFGPKLD